MQFDTIYNNNKQYVMRVALKWFKSECRAEEASQEFFFWLSRNLHNFDETKGTFKKWFNAHLAFKLSVYRHHLKFKGRGGNFELEITPEHNNMYVCNKTEREISGAMTRACIEKSMEKLSEAQRRVMLLCLNTDMDREEIAKTLGITYHGVKFQQKKSYPMMKKALLKEL